MEEIWKPIVGYEGLYEVSNNGNIKTLCDRHGKIRLLKPIKDKHRGYCTVNLFKNGKSKSYLVHRLVAEAFIPNPDNLPQVNHKNEIKDDNRAINLEYCTAKYNLAYSNVHLKGAVGVKIKRSKSVLQFTLDGRFVAEYKGVREAARQTGLEHSGICRCCKNKCGYNTAGGYIWKYKSPDN